MEEKYLYRAKKKDWEEWVSEEQWVQGSLIIAQDRYFIIESAKIDRYDELYISKYVEIDPSTICRYTGLIDKNKNLIWENDIVFITDEEGCSGQVDTGTGHIIFLEGLWYIDGRVQNGLYDIDKIFYIETIGNIFDNPELVKECQNEEQLEQE